MWHVLALVMLLAQEDQPGAWFIRQAALVHLDPSPGTVQALHTQHTAQHNMGDLHANPGPVAVVSLALAQPKELVCQPATQTHIQVAIASKRACTSPLHMRPRPPSPLTSPIPYVESECIADSRESVIMCMACSTARPQRPVVVRNKLLYCTTPGTYAGIDSCQGAPYTTTSMYQCTNACFPCSFSCRKVRPGQSPQLHSWTVQAHEWVLHHPAPDSPLLCLGMLCFKQFQTSHILRQGTPLQRSCHMLTYTCWPVKRAPRMQGRGPHGGVLPTSPHAQASAHPAPKSCSGRRMSALAIGYPQACEAQHNKH